MPPITEHERKINGDARSNDGVDVGAGRPYIAPRLDRYGDLRAITNTGGSSGKNEGKGMGKTGL